ncbi:hypothetical protein MASR2M16_18110 [Thauera terpenica]
MKIRIMLCALVGVLSAAPVAASIDIVKKARCVACHAVDKKMVGPSYREVAEKYKGQADAAALLALKVRRGGAGVWGRCRWHPTTPARSATRT